MNLYPTHSSFSGKVTSFLLLTVYLGLKTLGKHTSIWKRIKISEKSLSKWIEALRTKQTCSLSNYTISTNEVHFRNEFICIVRPHRTLLSQFLGRMMCLFKTRRISFNAYRSSKNEQIIRF